jgi:hypothetical protein
MTIQWLHYKGKIKLVVGGASHGAVATNTPARAPKAPPARR